MERNLQIQAELAEISATIAAVPFLPTYVVPTNYFEALPLFITGKIAAQSYTVPAQYFDTLSNKIIARINTDEKDALPSIFSKISKENVYTTPKQYFESHALDMSEAPVVSINTKPKRQWLKYAIAACVLALVSFTAIQFFTKSTTPTKTDGIVVIENTKVSYDELKKLNVDAAIDSLNVQEVDAYLCDNGMIACNEVKPVAIQSTKPTNNKSKIEATDITEEDVDAFLDN